MTDAGWHIDERCINCGAAQVIAPDIIVESGGQSVFRRQPRAQDEIDSAWRAALLCPTASVHAPRGMKPPPGLFPQELAPGLYRLGYNARSSYGAHSYAVDIEGARMMVDSPRWTRRLVDWFEAAGGLGHVLLTHRDDIADAKRYAKHFGARVWIHADDADAAPFATDILNGDNPSEPLPGLRVIPLPGHTKGSIAYLVGGTYLFTGDSLSWSHRDKALRAVREVCWYDWDSQLASLERLRNECFSWILAGHGGSIEADPDELQRALDTMLTRLKAA